MAPPTIKTQRIPVQSILANRVDLAVNQAGETHPKIDGWLSDAYVDLGNEYEFDGLVIGPLGLMTPGDNVTQYDTLPADLRGIKQVSLDPGTGKFQPLTPTDFNVIRRYSQTPGTPGRYARLGFQLWFDRVPNRSYPYQLTYWQKPQIVVDSTDNTSDIEGTPILLDDDWLEVLNHAAALRGWDYLEDQMMVQKEKLFLYGDPNDPRNIGIIKTKIMGRVADRKSAEYAITPRRIPYGYT